MQLSHINTNLLVALDVLLRERSVQRAAARQGVTPSAMSHSLRALRQMLDDPLLIRTREGMVPTPFAQRIARPLRRALSDLVRALDPGDGFEPAHSRRAFILSSPDFISTLLAGPMLDLVRREAPEVEIEIRPFGRRGNIMQPIETWLLEEGSIDLVIGAALGNNPELFTESLYDERFVCVVRRDNPRVDETLDLETYAAIPHVLISITDERSPTWIDAALAERGLTRRIRFRTRYFMSAALALAESDLLMTCPLQLARYFSRLLPLRILEPPLPLPSYQEYQAWHPRFDADPAHRWLRSVVKRAATAIEPTEGTTVPT